MCHSASMSKRFSTKKYTASIGCGTQLRLLVVRKLMLLQRYVNVTHKHRHTYRLHFSGMLHTSWASSYCDFSHSQHVQRWLILPKGCVYVYVIDGSDDGLILVIILTNADSHFMTASIQSYQCLNTSEHVTTLGNWRKSTPVNKVRKTGVVPTKQQRSNWQKTLHILWAILEGLILFTRSVCCQSAWENRSWVTEGNNADPGRLPRDYWQIKLILTGLNPGYIKDTLILHTQNHGCWCPGDARSQGIRNYDVDLLKTR